MTHPAHRHQLGSGNVLESQTNPSLTHRKRVPPLREPMKDRRSRGIHAFHLSALVALLVTGCAKTGSSPTVEPAAAAPTSLNFQAPTILSRPDTTFATAFVAASANGERAYAWTAASPENSGLMIQVPPASPAVLADADGMPAVDPETPAKIAFGPGGELYVAYSINELPKPAGKAPSPPTEPRTSFRVVRSDDQGRTWSTPGQVADDGSWGTYRNDHAFHVNERGTLFAAWLDSRVPDTVRLYFSRSSDRGATWSKNLAVDADSPCECCRIALASSAPGHVYMAWRKILPGGIRDIVVSHSADEGATWSAPVRSHADDWTFDGCPDAGPSLLAETNGRLHLVWWTGKEGAAGVRYVSSSDGGTTWGTAVPLKVGAASRPSHAQIARRADGSLYVVWDDGISSQPQIVVAVSRDGGRSFSAPQLVSEKGAAAVFPSVAVTQDSLTIVWHQPDPQHDSLHQVMARTAALR